MNNKLVIVLGIIILILISIMLGGYFKGKLNEKYDEKVNEGRELTIKALISVIEGQGYVEIKKDDGSMIVLIPYVPEQNLPELKK